MLPEKPQSVISRLPSEPCECLRSSPRARYQPRMSQPDPVIDAACRFLDDLIPILKEECPGGDDRPLELPGFPRWIPELVELGLGTRRYKAVPRFFTAEQQCAIRLLGELREAGMQSLADVDAALAADTTIGPRLSGQSVMSFGAGGGAWQGPSMVQLLVDRAISSVEAFDDRAVAWDFVATQTDFHARQWAQELRRPSDRITNILVLHEFEAPAVPILVEPGLEIDELCEHEIGAALSLGGGGARGFSLDERTISKTFGVRRSFDSQLFIDEIPPAESEREQTVRQDAEARAELVLLALRVFKAGRVGTSGRFQYVTSWTAEVAPVQARLGPGFGWHAGDPYVLADEEVTAFCEFWSAFAKVHERPLLASALRRFNFAADRTQADDEIVDLMIAAESLFLSEMDERYRGELRFRLSTRAASLLGKTLEERLSFFKFMRRAYDARSTIVHGSHPGEEELRGPDGESVTVSDFAEALEGVVRATLQVAINFLATGQRFPPAWEELMFAGPRDVTSD